VENEDCCVPGLDEKEEVGCVPEPLNVREPVLCIDPCLPDYPAPAYALETDTDYPGGLRTWHPY